MIEFSDYDYSEIAGMIADSLHDTFAIDYDFEDGSSVTIKGCATWDSYQETDAVCGYGNGTGAWINYGLYLTAEVDFAYDTEGNMMQAKDTNFDCDKLYDALYDELDICPMRYIQRKVLRDINL